MITDVDDDPVARARGRAVVGVYKAGTALAGALPDSVANAIAAGLSRTFKRAMGGRRRMLQRHMRRALGPEATPAQVRKTVDAAFSSYARYWVETFRIASYTGADLDRIFSIEGWEHIARPLDDGRGVILALPHVGQWEVAAAWMHHHGQHLTAVAERLDPPELYDWFVEMRENRLGLDIVSVDDPVAGRKLIEALRAGEVVTLLSDRDLTGNGPEVEFFGELTTLPAGPARLAIQTGAALVPVAVYEDGWWRYRAVLRPELEVPAEGTKAERTQALTQQLAYELEGMIRRAPSQWHLLQPNWPSDFEAQQRWEAETAGAARGST
ncbi:MAG: phosphatidylinositol mannoside acyltransferase [Acidimicrobiia bacterium]|nr:phosphatidylinositol mannoside acyltransferase [Acidimicrobiia bacterium]